MKQSVQPDAGHARKAAAAAASSRPARQPGGVASASRLAQLAEMMNCGFRAQAQLKTGIQNSPRVQSLTSMAAEINHGGQAEDSGRRTLQKKGAPEKTLAAAPVAAQFEFPGRQSHMAVQRMGHARSTGTMDPLQAPVVQRMIVNVGRKPLSDLDWVSLSTLAFALNEGGESQKIVEHQDADFSEVGEHERIYLVGHGTGVQTVGALKEGQINELGRNLKATLPKKFAGDIVAMCCRAGQQPEEGMSGVEMLALAMGRTDIPVYGPRGKSYSHSVLVPQALDPDQEDTPRPEYDKAKNKMSKTWQKTLTLEFRQKSIVEQAKIAEKISAEFYRTQIWALSQSRLLLEKGWLRAELVG